MFCSPGLCGYHQTQSSCWWSAHMQRWLSMCRSSAAAHWLMITTRSVLSVQIVNECVTEHLTFYNDALYQSTFYLHAAAVCCVNGPLLFILSLMKLLLRYMVDLFADVPHNYLLLSARQHPSYGDCLEVKMGYYQNCSELDCVTQCSQSAAHLYKQFLQVQQIGFVTLGSLRHA